MSRAGSGRALRARVTCGAKARRSGRNPQPRKPSLRACTKSSSGCGHAEAPHQRTPARGKQPRRSRFKTKAPPDPTGYLFRTGASLRIQITEKDQREMEIFRMRLAAPVVWQFPLNPSQRRSLPFIRPQRKEQAFSHRPRAAPADAPTPGAPTGGAPPHGDPRTAPAG